MSKDKSPHCECIYCKAFRYAQKTGDWTPLAIYLATEIRNTKEIIDDITFSTGKIATCLSDEDDKVGSLLASLEYNLEEAEYMIAGIDPSKVKIDGLLTITNKEETDNTNGN